MPASWNDLVHGASWDQANTALNGLPATLAQSYDPTKYVARQTPTTPTPTGGRTMLGKIWDTLKNWDKVAGRTAMAGVSKVGDFMTGGLLPAAVRKFDPSGQTDIENMQKEHPTAAAIGSGVGMAAGLGMPGGAVVKGAGILPKVANAAIGMAPYAVGAGATNLLNGGNVGSALKTAGVNELGGTVLGAGTGAAMEGLAKFLPGLKKGIINQSLSGDIGIQGKNFSKNLKELNPAPGSVIKRAEPMKMDLVNLANATRNTPMDITTDAGKLNFVNDVDRRWDEQVHQAYQTFKGQGGHLTDLQNEITSNPEVQQILTAHPQMKGELDNIVNTASQTADVQGIAAARKYLREQVIALGNRNGASDSAYLTGKLGDAVHEVVDNHFVPPDLKATYGRDKLIKQTLMSDVMKVPKVVRSGSDTAAKLLSHAVLAGAGSLIPGVGLIPAAIGIGGLVNDLTNSAVNKGMGKLATRIVPHLGEMTGQGVSAAAKAAPGVMGKIAGMAQASPPPAGQAPDDVASTQAKATEASVSTEGQQAAKDQTNSAWADQIKARLGALYDSMIAPMYGGLMSKDQFFQTAQQMTNNWDPHLTAGFVFQDKDQALAYLKSYDTALKLQGMNLDQALSAGGAGANPLTNPINAAVTNVGRGLLGEAPKTQENQMALENLKSVIVQHATAYGSKPDQSLINQISKMVDGIAAMRITPAKKTQILQDNLQEYGIDAAQLGKYGVSLFKKAGQQTGQNA